MGEGIPSQFHHIMQQLLFKATDCRGGIDQVHLKRIGVEKGEIKGKSVISRVEGSDGGILRFACIHYTSQRNSDKEDRAHD